MYKVSELSVQNREMFEIEGSRDRKSPLYYIKPAFNVHN